MPRAQTNRSRCFALFAILSVNAAFFAPRSASLAEPSGGAPEPGNTCHRWDLGDWRNYLEIRIKNFPLGLTQENTDLLHECAAEIERVGLKSCFSHLLQAAESASPPMMGFRQPVDQYLANEPQEMMAFPSELKDGLPENWKKIADSKKNWQYLQYASNVAGNAPWGTRTRLLFLIQYPRYDQWIQFTYPDENRYQERQIDMIVLEKTDGAPRIHFRTFTRDERGHNPVVRTKDLEKCYSCHAGGMRQLVPLEGSVKQLQMLETFRRAIASYGRVDWHDTIHPADHGPPAGKKQGCTACHNGRDRWPLNLFNYEIAKYKIMEDRTMPPEMGEQASGAEREQLWKDYESSYIEEVREWLRNAGACPARGPASKTDMKKAAKKS